MQGLVHADAPVARVSGIFKIVPPFDDAMDRVGTPGEAAPGVQRTVDAARPKPPN